MSKILTRHRLWQVLLAMLPKIALGAGSLSELPINMFPWQVSAGGDVLVGQILDGTGVYFQAVRWTPFGGSLLLGNLGGNTSRAYAVNAAGDVVVGYSSTPGDSTTRAFRWTAAGGMQDLGALNPGWDSAATAINPAGDVIAGTSGSYAFKWTQAAGMQSLGVISGYSASKAAGINSAGDVIVGSVLDGSSGWWTAFRWTTTGGIQALGNLGGVQSEATAVNASGSIVVGHSHDSTGLNRAFMWSQGTGMVALDTSAAPSDATAINASGNVIVGRLGGQAARWTPAGGLITIEQWLRSNGVAVAGSATSLAMTVNADGSVVAGQLSNGRAFIARVQAEGSANNGLIDIVQFQGTLATLGNIIRIPGKDVDLILHGAHGSPMANLLEQGKSSFWMGGDLGRVDRSQQRGNLGSGEIGVARGLADGIQMNLAIGSTFGQSDTQFGGRSQVKTVYVLPELVVQIRKSPLYVTASGFYARGNADLARGYQNAGTDVQSRGDGKVQNLAGRIRVDAKDLWSLSRAAFSPYASLTYGRTRVGSYTETGGGFPVAWDSRTSQTTTGRIGLDGRWSLNERTNVLGRMEGAHRFQARESGSSGEVLGLYRFNFDGAALQQSWMRLGLGLEQTTASKGKFSLMLNATTLGDDPSYWLAMSYHVPF